MKKKNNNKSDVLTILSWILGIITIMLTIGSSIVIIDGVIELIKDGTFLGISPINYLVFALMFLELTSALLPGLPLTVVGLTLNRLSKTKNKLNKIVFTLCIICLITDVVLFLVTSLVYLIN